MDFVAEQFSSEEISLSQHSEYKPLSQTSSSSSSSDSSQVNRIYVCDMWHGPDHSAKFITLHYIIVPNV